MEFRNCPSCKASVLEDDVADCPFCGASMSGKPSAKPAPKAGAGPAKSAPASAAKPTAPVAPTAKGASPTKTPAPATPARGRFDPEPERPQDSGDPFEVDPLAHKLAAQVSVKPAKGRTIEVKCPMCETVGFIAPSQAGKDVKCCNPSCKLPIFKAPKLPTEVVAEPEKARGLSTLMLTIIGLVAAGLTGGGIYWFVLREEPKPPVVGPIDTGPLVPETPETPEHLDNKYVPPTKHVVSTVAEIKKLSREDLVNVIVQRDIRSKPYGRQLAAEGFLALGNLAGAKEQIGKMGTNGGTYAIGPLAHLAQQQLDGGDKAGAEASLNEAVTHATKLLDVGRPALDSVAELAAALIRLDRIPEASKLLGRYAQKGSDDRAMLSLFWRASLDRGSFDFQQESSLSHLELCGKPLWISTAIQLCRYKQWDQALAWAKSAPDQVTQDAGLAACAGMMSWQLVRQPDPAMEAQLKAAIESAGLAAKVRMQVAAAEVRLMAGDKGVTKATVTEIEALLATTPIPPVAIAPGIKKIYDSKGLPFAGLPDPAPGTSLALGWGDIANLQMKLGDMTGGWATQAKALEMLRSVSPSPAMAKHLVDQCADNAEVVKNQLDAALSLRNDVAKRLRALSQYRVQCEVIYQLTTDRFAMQQTLLRRSIRYGLHAEVWKYVQEIEQGEMAEIDPYRSQSTLLTDLYYSTLVGGQKEFTIQAYKEYSANEQNAVKVAVSTVGKLAGVNALVRAGDASKVADILKPLYVGTAVDRHTIDRQVFEAVGELAHKSVGASYTLMRRLGLADPMAKEDALRLLAGWAISHGQGPELWKLMDADREITSTDRAAIYLGFLEGIQASGAK